MEDSELPNEEERPVIPNSRLKLSVTASSGPISLEYETSQKRFNEKLQQVGQQIPDLIQELTGTATVEPETEALHNYVVTESDAADKLLFSFDELSEWRFVGYASELYDGQIDLLYQKDDLSWATLATIVGDAVHVIQTIADASMLNGDNVISPVPKFPFVIQVKVHTKASAGTASIWVLAR